MSSAAPLNKPLNLIALKAIRQRLRDRNVLCSLDCVEEIRRRTEVFVQAQIAAALAARRAELPADPRFKFTRISPRHLPPEKR
jgi:hypothetical protein